MLLNLASNAVKHNAHGGRITIAYAPAAGGRIAVTVRDTGPGVPPGKMERLFLPFDRLGAEQTDVQGTGLGLACPRG